MMRELDINPITQSDLTPFLDPYCDFNHDIMQIIFEYSGNHIKQSLIEYSHTIIESSMTKELRNKRSWQGLLLGILFIPAYFPLF